MFVEILIALCKSLIIIYVFTGVNFSSTNFDECTASKVCNHTWTPVCGHIEEEESSYRLFLDGCDLHEYNCDNNLTYVEVDTKVCSTKCTQRDQANISTTPILPIPPPPPKVSTNMTTEEIKPETTKITSTKQISETIKDKTDTSTIFVAPTILEMTTKETTKKQTLEITAKGTATSTTEATITTNVYASTDVTTIKPIIETTTAIGKIKPPTLNNKNNINDDENTIPVETSLSASVATPAKLKLECYPNRCSMPSTWETTSVGETRDFVQLLRERYGNRITFLRDTTHFPKQPTYARKSTAFIPGYHRDRQKEQYYVNKLDTIW